MAEHALVVGEALIDIVREPDGAEHSHPGGSPANVAIGLGRLRRRAELLAWLALDDHGLTIREHLAESDVELVRGSESALNTSTATALLNAAGVATYDFDIQWAVSPIAAPTRKPLVMHTGSIAATLPPGAASVRELMAKHRDTATITYDPNARPAIMGNPVTAATLIEQAVTLSDVVKVSDEDLEWLFADEPIAKVAKRWLALGPAIVVVTRGGDGATAYTADGRTIDVTAPRVKVADTVGAGDSFMSGLIDGLWTEGLLGAENREQLAGIETDVLTYILNRCVGIAAITVSRPGANPPTRAELGEEPPA